MRTPKTLKGYSTHLTNKAYDIYHKWGPGLSELILMDLQLMARDFFKEYVGQNYFSKRATRCDAEYCSNYMRITELKALLIVEGAKLWLKENK